MKLFGKLTSTIRSWITVAILATAALSSIHAATIKMECKVAGYSKAGWIEVRPGSGTGGRVQYDSRHRVYYTDRVSRSEQVRISFLPNKPSEYCHNGGWIGAFADNGCSGIARVRLPLFVTGRVTPNPHADNVHVWVSTSAGYFQQRVPIGKR